MKTSTVKKSVAAILAQCAFRNVDQGVRFPRSGAGSKHDLHGHAMPKVVQTWTVPVRRSTQPDLPRQSDERLPGIVVAHACAMPGHEERSDAPAHEVLVATSQIICQRRARRGMQWNQAGLKATPLAAQPEVCRRLSYARLVLSHRHF